MDHRTEGPGQPGVLAAVMSAPKPAARLTEAEGAGARGSHQRYLTRRRPDTGLYDPDRRGAMRLRLADTSAARDSGAD